MNKKNEPAFTGARALEALASPIRQEIVSAFQHGPLSVRDLAATLGRTRQALHYHVAQLANAGILRVAETRGSGRAAEQVFQIAKPTVSVGARRTAADLHAAERAAGALLRLTSRELTRAIRDAGVGGHGGQRAMMAARAKCRLTSGRLQQINTLLDEVFALLGEAHGDTTSPSYALTVVLTPVPHATSNP